MNPILAAHTRTPLRPGVRTFRLRWAVPAGLRHGTSRQLSAEWLWTQPPPGDGERIVAEFDVLPPAT
jgi:hypothetical protein